VEHPDTLTTSHNVAGWIGRSGDVRRALGLVEELLAVQERVLGVEHPDTQSTRSSLTHLKGMASVEEAVRLVRESSTTAPLLELPAELRPIAEQLLRVGEEDPNSTAF
jgi:hypothetical protein